MFRCILALIYTWRNRYWPEKMCPNNAILWGRLFSNNIQINGWCVCCQNAMWRTSLFNFTKNWLLQWDLLNYGLENKIFQRKILKLLEKDLSKTYRHKLVEFLNRDMCTYYARMYHICKYVCVHVFILF